MCSELLKDSPTVVTLISPRYEGEVDVPIKQEHTIWIEVAETPECLRHKLLQLERAVRFFQGKPPHDISPTIVGLSWFALMAKKTCLGHV